MNPQFPIYIVSKGRHKSRFTSKTLEKMGVPYRIVVEAQQRDDYAAVIDPKKVLVLDPTYQRDYDTFDDLGDTKSKGPGAARNFAWEHAIAEGHAWHWVMDDNIRYFYRLDQNCYGGADAEVGPRSSPGRLLTVSGEPAGETGGRAGTERGEQLWDEADRRCPADQDGPVVKEVDRARADQNARARSTFTGSFHHKFKPEGCGQQANSAPSCGTKDRKARGVRPNRTGAIEPSKMICRPGVVGAAMISAAFVRAGAIGNASPLPFFPGNRSSRFTRSNRSRNSGTVMPHKSESR